VTLDQLPLGQHGVITAIDHGALGEAAARRLQAMGIDVGAVVEPFQRGILWSDDPIALRLGRMTIAMRKVQAAAVSVTVQP
jgi:ferrous iron transport protein A